MDDIEDYWAELRPAPKPRIRTEVIFGYVWMGLLSGNGEIRGYEGYTRRQIRVPPESPMEFRGAFSVGGSPTITGVGVYSSEDGDVLLWQRHIDPRVLAPGVTFDMSLVITDLSGEAAQFVSFRKILQMHGVL